MHRYFYRVLSVLCIALLLIPATWSNTNVSGEAPQELAELTNIIIQFEEVPITQQEKLSSSAYKDKKASYKKKHKKFIDSVNAKGIDTKVKKEFFYSFNGLSVSISKKKLKEIESIPGVKAVYPDIKVQAQLENSVPVIKANQMWEKADENRQSLTGNGMIVAVLDTGVDYTHPDLGGGFGEDFKVVGGYDFVNNDTDPMDDHGHGTHVAGIVAANGKLKGIAPDANITAYKVLDDRGGGTTSDIVAAIDRSIDPTNPYRADVINLSLGGPGDGQDPLSQAAQHAVDSGVIVVAAAGNAGPDAKTIISPAAAEGVIAVGASVSGIMAPVLRMTAPEVKEFASYIIPFSDNPPVDPVDLELVDVGDGWDFSYQENLDITGKAVIMPSYNEWADKERVRIAKEKGAIAVILVAQEEITSSSSLSKTGEAEVQSDGMYVVGVDLSDGQELLGRLADSTVKISISGVDVTDRLAGFSSRGPSGYPRMKPDLVAPGVLINSMNLRTDYDPAEYVKFSGTSMASPHVAGAAALLKQSHPNWTVAEIRAALVETSVPLDNYTPAEQGAGRLDIVEADTAKILAQPHTLSFGIADLGSAEISQTKTLKLQNKSNQPVVVNLENQSSESSAVVEFSQNSVTIDAEGSKTVDVTIKADKTPSSADFTGWIKATSDSGESIRVAYHFGVRYLEAFASPDPTSGEAGIYIVSPTPLKEAPVVTIIDPKGKEKKVTAVHHHDNWYEAKLTVKTDGIYHAKVSATANEVSNFAKISGETVFEVLPPDRNGKKGWEGIGPNATGGEMVVDPENPGTLYVHTGDLKGLFVTKDYGKSWEQFRDLPVATGEPIELVLNPQNSDQLFLAINGGSADRTYGGKILVSNNRGKSWTTTKFPSAYQLKNIEVSNDGKLLIATGNYSIFVSKDLGETWEEITTLSYIFTSEYHEGKLFVGTGDGLYVIENVLNKPTEPKFLFNQEYSSVLKIMVHDGYVYANTSNALYKAPIDGDGEFTQIGSDKYGAFLLLGIEDGKIYATNYEVILESSIDELNWTEIKNPVEGSDNMQVAKWPNRDTLLVSSGSAGIFETADNGETYKRVGTPITHIYDLAVSMDSNKNYKVYAASIRNVYQTTFKSEKDLSSEWGYSGSEAYFNESAYAVATSPEDSDIVYKVIQMYNSFGIYKSIDGGATWEFLYTHPDFGIGFLDLLIHPSDPDTVYMSFKKWDVDSDGYIVSHDGGQTWTEKTVGKTIRALAGDPEDPNKVWFGTDQGLFVSEDKGETLAQLQSMPVREITYSLTENKLLFGGERLYSSMDGGKTIIEGIYGIDVKVSEIVQSPNDPNTYYAATTFNPMVKGLYRSGRGVLKSTDGGLTWSNFSYGLDNLDVLSLAISPDGKYLFAGTQSGGVHKIELR